MSGVDFNGSQLRKGAGDSIAEWIVAEGGHAPPELRVELDRIGREGGTPLAVARDERVLGVIYLKDIVKEGMKARFDQLRAMGIRTIMVTGDNKLTAAKIAEEAGVDDFLAEATPERKLELIKEQQADGRLIAMTGDGTNDAPALAQADVGVAMNTGTQAAREAGNMVDLDSNPTKLIEIVEVGKQLLITRGALTTFSIANDVAKYFAILPAMFAATCAAAGQTKGPLHSLNIMHLGTPESAILSAVIFNALIIPLLIPLSLKGVALPGDRGDGAAAPQHADLRPRRPDRPLHRDQADRPRRPQPAGGVRWAGRRRMHRRARRIRLARRHEPAAPRPSPKRSSGRWTRSTRRSAAAAPRSRSTGPRSPKRRRSCSSWPSACAPPRRCRARRCASLRSAGRRRRRAALRPLGAPLRVSAGHARPLRPDDPRALRPPRAGPASGHLVRGLSMAGRLKVFLGMAAGVGKTYRMLQEGQAELVAGRDVVIGYLEPHDRPETTEQARGLEVVPRREVEFRGTADDGDGPRRRCSPATRSWR